MGVAEFNKITQISANPSKRVRMLDLSTTEEILSGGQLVIELYAPVGYLSQLLNMYIVYPAVPGAVAGNLSFYLVQKEPAGHNLGIFTARTTDQTGILQYFNYDFINGPYDLLQPNDVTGRIQAFKNSLFDEDNPLILEYKNSTDKSDGGSQKVARLWILDEKIS